MRLVDADGLIALFENLSYKDWNQDPTTTLAQAYRKAAEVVRYYAHIDTPSEEKSHVICSECAYGGERTASGQIICPLAAVLMDPDDYCSKGICASAAL